MRHANPAFSCLDVRVGQVTECCREYLNAAGVNYVVYHAGLRYAQALARTLRNGARATRERRIARLRAHWIARGMDPELVRDLTGFCLERLRSEQSRRVVPRRMNEKLVELAADRAIVAYRQERGWDADHPVTPRFQLLAFARELLLALVGTVPASQSAISNLESEIARSSQPDSAPAAALSGSSFTFSLPPCSYDWPDACKAVVQRWWLAGVSGRLLALVGAEMRERLLQAGPSGAQPCADSRRRNDV
ncbi:hypothetical protein JXD38_06150 [candidate division WOR-3 bacterium]|nr:hypothetical protein [candidate division WOR-3 bacterium]